ASRSSCPPRRAACARRRQRSGSIPTRSSSRSASMPMASRACARTMSSEEARGREEIAARSHMMIGITAHGAYIPAARLPRDLIARGGGGASLGGEKAIASHDEDSLTLAVGAALNCLPDPEAATLLDGVLFASTTSPYREKQVAATIATVL